MASPSWSDDTSDAGQKDSWYSSPRRLSAGAIEFSKNCAATCERNKSILLMISAQFFSSLMAVTSKVLQTKNEERGALSTIQVLVTMMTITMAMSWIWMCFTRTPNAPFGPKALCPLLVARGVSGVFGIWGFYYSLRYLHLSEATVINFLSPMVAAFASALLMRTPFSLGQQIAGGVSLMGVVLVSQPWKMIGKLEELSFPRTPASDSWKCTNCTTDMFRRSNHLAAVPPTPMEYTSAIAAALFGVMGGAVGYVVLVRIGTRAHHVITVNYFAACTVFMGGLSLAFTGADDLRFPNLREWLLLSFLGVFGFALQHLQAASLQCEKSSKALNMVYIQIVFALVADKVVWDLSPDVFGLTGGILILASVSAVAWLKETGGKENKGPKREIHAEEGTDDMTTTTTTTTTMTTAAAAAPDRPDVENH